MITSNEAQKLAIRKMAEAAGYKLTPDERLILNSEMPLTNAQAIEILDNIARYKEGNDER